MVALYYFNSQWQMEQDYQNRFQSHQAQQEEQSIRNGQLINQDPYAPSYQDSAIKHLPYRIGILVFAIFMIFLGKTNLVALLLSQPSNSVPCIEDVILDYFQPVTNYFLSHQGLGLTLVSIMQLIVDLELVSFMIYWLLHDNSIRYPLVMAIVGISKMLLNFLFQTKQINNSFSEQAFPSLVFGSNFNNTYFFSGVTCLLMANLLELYQNKFNQLRSVKIKLLLAIQTVVLVYVICMLMLFRQNFFMDIATALVFTHYVFYFINDRIRTIDRCILRIYERVTHGEQKQFEKGEAND